MSNHSFWVYIVASEPCGWLYVGMTNDLVRRIGEHKHGQVDGYSRDVGPICWSGTNITATSIRPYCGKSGSSAG